MPDRTFTLKQNAVRAARKLMADNKAPAPNFEIKTAAAGGFRIVWNTSAAVEGTAEPTTVGECAEHVSIDAARIEQPTEAESEYKAERDVEAAERVAPIVDDASVSAKRRVKTRDGTKQEMVIEMLKRPEGASDAEIKTATGWKIVRGFIAGMVKKKLGYTVISSKEAERGRIYRVVV